MNVCNTRCVNRAIKQITVSSHQDLHFKNYYISNLYRPMKLHIKFDIINSGSSILRGHRL